MFARLKAFLATHSHSHAQGHAHAYKGHLFQDDLQHIHGTLDEAAAFNVTLRQMAADADKAATALDTWQSSASAFAQSVSGPRQYITTTRQDTKEHLPPAAVTGKVSDAGEADREVLAATAASPLDAAAASQAAATTSTHAGADVTPDSLAGTTTTTEAPTIAATDGGAAPSTTTTTTPTTPGADTDTAGGTTPTTSADAGTGLGTTRGGIAGEGAGAGAGAGVTAETEAPHGSSGVTGAAGTAMPGLKPQTAVATVGQAGAVASAGDHVTAPNMVPVEEPSTPAVTALVSDLVREVGHGAAMGNAIREQLVEPARVYGRVLEVAQARLAYLRKHPGAVSGAVNVSAAGEATPAEELAKLQAAAVWLVKAAQGLRGLVASSLLAGLRGAGYHTIPLGIMPELSAQLLVMPQAVRRKGRLHGLSPAPAPTSSAPAATAAGTPAAATPTPITDATPSSPAPVDITGPGEASVSQTTTGVSSEPHPAAPTSPVVATTAPVAYKKDAPGAGSAVLAATLVDPEGGLGGGTEVGAGGKLEAIEAEKEDVGQSRA